MLTEKDKKALQQRKKLLGALPVFSIAVPALWVAVFVYMWTQHPRLVNPGHVAEGLLQKRFDRSALESMALVAPVMGATLLGMILVVLVFGIVALRRERRWIELIETMSAELDNPGPQ